MPQHCVDPMATPSATEASPARAASIQPTVHAIRVLVKLTHVTKIVPVPPMASSIPSWEGLRSWPLPC